MAADIARDFPLRVKKEYLHVVTTLLVATLQGASSSIWNNFLLSIV